MYENRKSVLASTTIPGRAPRVGNRCAVPGVRGGIEATTMRVVKVFPCESPREIVSGKSLMDA
jgi:hypothetical protein